MTLPNPISAAQTAAKAAVDEALMDAIRLDLAYLDANLAVVGAYDLQFKFNGYLSALLNVPSYRVDGAYVGKAQTFVGCQVYLEKPGTGGTLTVDVRRYTKPDVVITALTRQFNQAINSIARVGASLNTQSISRATAQVTTQTITKFKADLNISSIVCQDINLNLWRLNLTAQPDADWLAGDSITVASASTAGNNGTFVIVDVNADGGNNLVVTNAAGAVQSGAAGTASLLAFSYNLTNPAAAPAFTAGEAAHFASHTAAGNNGDLVVYAVNSGGNNIVVKNPGGATQGGAVGTIDTNRFIYAMTAPVSTTDYAVGETAHCAGHTSGGDNGDFAIKLINSGGNNLHLYIPSGGVTQGGVAGTVDTNRWAYFFSTDPAAGVTAGDIVIPSGTTGAANGGEFVVKQVDRSTNDNVVVYNLNGVAQAGAAGTLVSKLMVAKFAADQSANITTASRLVIFGTNTGTADGDFQVQQVNRGGGANFNAVILVGAAGLEAVGPCGRVVAESKSIFTTLPSILIPPSTSNFKGTHLQVSTNAVLDATLKTIPGGTLVAMDIISIPGGDPKNLVVQLN